MAQGDLGCEGFKVIACLGACCRLSEIAIEHVDPLGVPAQALGAADQGALRELTVEMLPHLLGARLPDIDHGLPFKMAWGDFDLAQLEIGVHQWPPLLVVAGWADGSATVARRCPGLCGRTAADCVRDVPTVDGGQSGPRDRAVVPLGQDGLASLLAP